MIKKVDKYILEKNMIDTDDKILIALSGGPDSVCLLHILYRLKEIFNFEVGAVHINHSLRGKESELDEEYTNRLCEKLGIRLYIKRIDIQNIASERGISLELAGRECRYEVFDEIKKREGYTKVAVAHNMNDQAETIIMRLMRGTGLDGLCGIRPIREDGVIRPILCLNRTEIEEYCYLNNLNPRIDKSNLERIYSRNKIRLDILPYMKKNFNEDIINTLNRTVDMVQKDNDFIEEQANLLFSQVCNIEGNYVSIKRNLIDNHSSLQSRVIKKALGVVAGTNKNFEMKHIEECIALFNKKTGKRIDLPNNIYGENRYGIIFLKRNINIQYKNNIGELNVKKEGIDNTKIEYGEYFIKFNLIKDKNKIEFSNNDLIKYFDYDKIEEGIIIRTRRNGDKIKPIGLNGSKKLKDIFINLKVDKEERDRIPLVCTADKILWIVGIKTADECKIIKDTKNILKITFIRKEY